MLPSTPQVEAVYLDPWSGILAGLRELPVDTPFLPSPSLSDIAPRLSQAESISSTTTISQPSSGQSSTPSPHTLLIDQTTLDPTMAVSVAERIQSETDGRAFMLDAPVSGGE